MSNPLAYFAAEGSRLTNLVGRSYSIPEDQLSDFEVNQRRLDFLQDLVSRVKVLAYCYDSICSLSNDWKNLQATIASLPPDSGQPNVRTVPKELADEEENWLVKLDAFISLIYYEVASLVRILEQLDVKVDSKSEVQYLVKIRNLFLSHVQLSSLMRGPNRGWSMPESGGFIERDVVALSSWGSDDLRKLGEHALKIGSPEWKEQRRKNEQLVLSGKQNEDLTESERLNLMAAGVRECRLELALKQLAELLESDVLPIIEKETTQAIDKFGFERWSDYECKIFRQGRAFYQDK